MTEAIRQGDIPGVQLRCRQELACTTGEAWIWLTEVDRLSRWLASSVVLKELPSRELHLDSRLPQGSRREIATTLQIEPTRRWLLSFRRLDEDWPVATRLTFELRPSGDRCEISVFHEGFAHLPLSQCLTIWEEYRRRWHAALSRLAELIARR